MYNLENLFLFNGLTEAQIHKIISSLPECGHCKKGTEIYNNNKFEKAMVIILSGKAEAFDDNLLKKSFGEGDAFGVAALFGNEISYISRIVTKSECTVQYISEDMLNEMFAEYPITAVNYITFLSDKIRLLNKKIRLFTCKSAAARLYQYLTENADNNNTVRINNMSKLAKLTSIGRTSLYRAVNELIDAGMIEKCGSEFIIK